MLYCVISVVHPAGHPAGHEPQRVDTLDLEANEIAMAAGVLVVPLYTQGEQIGVIVLGKRRQGRDYTEGDLDVLDILADQVAGVVVRCVLQRIVALGGSFSSLALIRALHYTPYVRGVALMGGLADVYRLRYDVYMNGYTGHTVNPHLERAMWSLGRQYVEKPALFL